MKNKKGFLAMNIGLIYILPWLVGFLLFKVYPFASSLYYSFTNYDLFNGITKYRAHELRKDILLMKILSKHLRLPLSMPYLMYP